MAWIGRGYIAQVRDVDIKLDRAYGNTFVLLRMRRSNGRFLHDRANDVPEK